MSAWRLGRHVPLHVYEDAETGNYLDDRPIAMFRDETDARAAVEAHNAVERVRAEVETWRHTVVDDCWYTCPAATEEREGETCCNDAAGTDCDCGLDARKARLLAALDGAE